jgi:hypothetical protein
MSSATGDLFEAPPFYRCCDCQFETWIQSEAIQHKIERDTHEIKRYEP